MLKDRKKMLRERRKKRIRRNISGTQGRPRLSVFRSLKHIYVQVIDDSSERTIMSLSTLSRELREKLKNTRNILAAQMLGTLAAERLSGMGIKSVVFDRSGYKYHGRIKALADALRAGGLKL